MARNSDEASGDSQSMTPDPKIKFLVNDTGRGIEIKKIHLASLANKWEAFKQGMKQSSFELLATYDTEDEAKAFKKGMETKPNN